MPTALAASTMPSVTMIMTHSPVSYRFCRVPLGVSSGVVRPNTNTKRGGSACTKLKKLKGAKFVTVT